MTANETKPDDTLPPVTIGDVPEKIRQAAARAGWKELMPVQAKAIPYVLAGKDLMMQSRTGSGKTGAFILPILERIDFSRVACQALVLVPTRELALQVARESELLCGTTGVRTVAVHGGVGYGPQIEGFRKGAHIVVGTPGRILDHLLKRTLTLDALDILVFDEADRMLSMGFYPDMKRVQNFLPKKHIDGYMFSATFPPYVMRLANEFLEEPEMISLSHDHVHVVDTEHTYYLVPAMKKERCLARIIEMENPTQAMIFCNTKVEVHYVAVVLRRFGYDADELSSDLSQDAREKVLDHVRNGTLRYLVATDVAARGIDIPELSHVILYDTPEDPEAYIHRAGRTGRAGAKGQAISLVGTFEKNDLLRIGRRYGIDLQERPLPTEEEVQEIVSQRVTALLEARLRTRDSHHMEYIRRFLPLAKTLGQDEDEAAIIAMLLDDFYQQTLHAAEPAPKPEQRTAHEPSHNKPERTRRRERKRRRK